jgi:hypothetical protein
MSYDPVNHPAHYTKDRKYEPLAVIEDWKLNYRTGSALKYISRAGRKEDTVQDLQKAIFYLQREVDSLQKPNPYAVTYRDVLEDYDYECWDPSLGPAEPHTTPTTGESLRDLRLRQGRTAGNDYTGQAEWS